MFLFKEFEAHTRQVNDIVPDDYKSLK